ncbi:MAG: ATP-binding protein [Fusobacteriaceae bacterium]
MVKELQCHQDVKNFLKNELTREKSSATYLFHGNDTGQLLEIALAFAKGLNCSELPHDFCGQCSICKRIESHSYPDLEILDGEKGIKIAQIREIIEKSAVTSYEGGKKIFILENFHKVSKEVSNALLKTIEEPPVNNFFILLSPTLNILPTVKSRAVIVKIPLQSPEDLGVTQEAYDFFRGNSKDLKAYREGDYNLEDPLSYEGMGKHIDEYIKNGKKIEEKIAIFRGLRDFSYNRKWLSPMDRLFFVDILCRGVQKERELIFEILSYLAYLEKNPEQLKRLLEAKNSLRLPLNMRYILLQLFL